MIDNELKTQIYIGVVVDNNDPKRLGRCRVKVLNIFDTIPNQDIPWASPWKDLNGNSAFIPDIGKVVSVVFDSGNIYKPEYICSEHYNTNLEKKLSNLSPEDYASMRAIMFDHKTQIYSNDSEGLKIDYKFNNINITESDININLKDNFGKVNIGTNIANQQAILGNNFLNWFDEFVDNLLGSFAGPYLESTGNPVVPNPKFVACLQRYKSLKDPKFLSSHVNIVDNEYVNKQERDFDAQIGDAWGSTIEENEVVNKEVVDFLPKSGNSTDGPLGQVTVSEGTNDISDNTNQTVPEIIPSENPDINSILETMKRKNYVIYTKPYQMNMIGIRRQYEGMVYSNRFVDDMYLIYRETNDGDWVVHKYKITTLPGVYKGEQRPDLKDRNGQVPFTPNGWKHPDGKISSGTLLNKASIRFTKNRPGLGQLRPSQMIDKYYLSTYFGKPALKDKGGLFVYRDQTPDTTITYSIKTQGRDYFIHRAGKNSSVVNNWSEGCQVFKTHAEMDHFISKLKEHEKRYGNSFTYTLMEERDITT